MDGGIYVPDSWGKMEVAAKDRGRWRQVEHWLKVRQRVRFKLASIMYKSLSGQATQYLAHDVQLLADSGRTASPSISQLQNMRRSSDTEQRLFCGRT